MRAVAVGLRAICNRQRFHCAGIPLHKIPVEGLAFLLGIYKFMSEGRALTNIIGNGVATIVIAKSENEFHPPGGAS